MTCLDLIMKRNSKVCLSILSKIINNINNEDFGK